MKIEINDKLLEDFKKNIIEFAPKDTYTEIIEYLLKEKLIEGGFDGYEIDNLTGFLSLSRFKKDLDKIVRDILNEENNEFYRTILYFNINNLKYYNDIKGFAAGNELIKIFANQIRKLYSERIYRIGGQEFIAVSFDNIELKNNISINDIILNQCKIVIKLKKIKYPVKKEYLKEILRYITRINKITNNKIYKLKL